MKAGFLQNFTQFGDFLSDLVNRTKPKEERMVQERPVKYTEDDSFEGIQEILLLKMALEYSDDVVLKEETGNITQVSNEERTLQFQRNQHTIKQALEAYISVHGKMPSQATLAKLTGFSRPTIYAHFREGALNLNLREEMAKLKLVSSNLFAKLYQLAMDGDKQAIKMVFDILVSGQKMQAGTQSNYIQVNNLKIQNHNLDRLTPRTKKKIERLIRKDLRLED